MPSAAFKTLRRALGVPLLGALLVLVGTATMPAAFAQDMDLVDVEVQATVNINSATMEELAQALTGVGGSKAEAIVRYRELYGPFESIDELAEVTGIGASTVERNRPRIRLQ